MKFLFPYEKILEHRKTKKEVLAREQAQAQHELLERQGILSKLYKQVDQTREEIYSEQLKTQVDLEKINFLNDFITGQDKRIENQIEKVKEQMADVEIRREKHKAAAIEYKVLDILRSKKWKEFIDKKKKYEQKNLDEAVTMRYKIDQKDES